MAASDEDRELGEALYMKIQKYPKYSESAGKITGMMLESLEEPELRKLMDDESSLKGKVEQAFQVLLKGEDPPAETQEENGGGKAKESKEIRELKEELGEAEKWAEEMQGEWDAKEAEFKKEKEQLKKRVSAAEDRAKAAETASKTAETASKASSKASTNGTDKIDLLTAKVKEAEAGLDASKGETAEAKKDLRKMEDELRAAQKEAKEAKEAAAKASKEVEAATKASKEVEAPAKASKEGPKASKGWDEDKSDIRLKAQLVASQEENSAKDAKHKAELAVKDGELQRALKAGASGNKEELQNGKAHAAKDEVDALKTQLRKAEEEAVNAQTAAAASEEKARRCRELQQDLDNANAQNKSYKAQMKDASDKLAKAPSKDTAVLQKRLTETTAEIMLLQKTLRGAGIEVPKFKPEPPAEPKPPKEKKAKPAVEAKSPVEAKSGSPPQAETPPEQEEEEEEDEPEEPEEKRRPSPKPVPDAKNKVQPTSAGKSSKKNRDLGAKSASDAPVALSKKKRESSFPVSGTQVVAGSLVVVVMIQLGLFVYEGWFGDQQTWVQ